MLKTRQFLSMMALALILVLQTACGSNTPVAPTLTIEPSLTRAPSKTPRPSATPTVRPSETPAPQANSTSTTITNTLQTPEVTLSLATAALPTQPAATIPAGAVEDKALYVGQNLADNSYIKPGTNVTIIWTIKNVGKTTWNTKYLLRYFFGPKGAKDSYPFPKDVAPNASVELKVDFTAPSQPGSYNTWWKLTNEYGQNFSDVNFTFVVSNDTKNVTATPSP